MHFHIKTNVDSTSTILLFFSVNFSAVIV